MIKAVIFDVGGVLIRTEDPAPRRALEIKYNLEPGQAEYLAFNSEMGRAAQRGEITTAELWARVGERLGMSGDEPMTFYKTFFAGDFLDTGLMAFIRSLRPRYRTGIISNAQDNLHQVLGEFYPVIDAFDVVVGSAYEGVMKPDPAIYRAALARLGVEPGEAVFIDDFAHNIAGAEAVGMHGIHFTPGLDLPAALAQLGVTP